jgi:hypothetical protein
MGETPGDGEGEGERGLNVVEEEDWLWEGDGTMEGSRCVWKGNLKPLNSRALSANFRTLNPEP